MNKRWLIISLTGLILLFLIAACAQSVATPLVEETQEDVQDEVVNTETPLAETQEDVQDEVVNTETPATEPQDDEQVEALIIDKCSGCHSADRVFQADYDQEGWANVIDRMVNKGADVSPDEKQLMIDWLVSREE